MSPALPRRLRGSRRDNDIDLEPDELGRDLGEALAASLRPAILDRDGATLDPAEFAQPLHKSGGPLAPGRRRARAQEPDGRQLRRLLRARRERPRAAAPPRRVMNSRRRISAPKLRGQHCIGSNEYFDRAETGHQNHCRSAQPMSEMGHEQAKSDRQIKLRYTSISRHRSRRPAGPLRATTRPEQSHKFSFNHPVGPQQDRRGYPDAERFCRR